MPPYIVFDVETPNSRNDRISAIGISVIQNGRITQAFGTLVNPETHFDPFNIALTGISPAAVHDAPTFPEVWDSVGEAFSAAVLLAHNAPFDMGVLSKCLNHYLLPHPPTLTYACTCRMARRAYPKLPRHTLDAMCSFLDIPLDHHKADSDANAAAALFLRMTESGLDPLPFLRAYDVAAGKTVKA